MTKIGIYGHPRFFDMDFIFEDDFLIDGVLTHFVEEWRQIPKANDGYMCSSFGRIKSPTQTVVRPQGNYMRQGRIRAVSQMHTGHFSIGVRVGYTIPVHRLVCIIFNGEPPTPRHQADHKDNIPYHNHYTNLQWLTPSENIKKSFSEGNARNDIGIEDSQSRPIVQMDMSGNVVAVYGSMREMRRRTGFGKHCVLLAATGVYSQANGFLWRRISKEDAPQYEAMIPAKPLSLE